MIRIIKQGEISISEYCPFRSFAVNLIIKCLQQLLSDILNILFTAQMKSHILDLFVLCCI